ncbi:MAG: hypothetical protein GF411_15230 [Candidatus Lokiarchaeota archaeon]|nr:hypothetical protein [Candidatus Lokiarchaeota archaeon]
MRPPCELVQKEYLPLVRAKVAQLLHDQDLSQTEIASKLDITQAAVSKYLREADPPKSNQLQVKRISERIAHRLLSPSYRPSEILYELCSACMLSRVSSEICQRHTTIVPILAENNCQICSDLLSGRNTIFTSRTKIVQDMHQALKLIEESVVFPNFMPEVRPNLVVCEDSSTTPQDVLAVPGRISLVHGKARALMQPQFGASQHTAEILLWAKETWRYPRACLSLRGQDDLVQTADTSGFNVVVLDNACIEASEIIKQAKEFEVNTDSHLAISVPGGIGIEPILYTFGPSAVSLVKRVITMADFLEK